QQLVLVELWADWAAPSVELSPILASLAERAQGAWALARVNVDTSPQIAQAFGAQSVPMVVALAGGQPVAAFNGVQSEDQIAGWINDVFAKIGDGFGAPPAAAEPADEPQDPRMAAAEALMDSGDFDGALAAYRAIAEVEPANTEAVSVVRNLEFVLRAQAHEPDIVQNAAPNDVDAQLAAADVLLLGQRPEEAFDRIIAVVRTSAGDDRTRARTRLLELFELFDPAEPFVVAARRKLAAALY
ncbi:MAG: tetratricopeptide repeat protein, partial [Gordonia sp. (in: high G+C Gram-positive bacteria)]